MPGLTKKSLEKAKELTERLKTGSPYSITNRERMRIWIEEALDQAIQDEREAKDEAYRQRNYLVAALARLFHSGIMKTDIPGWSEDWRGCCFIDLPTGQISYHYHDSHAFLFKDMTPYKKEWDGHNKELVHERLSKLKATAIRNRERKV